MTRNDYRHNPAVDPTRWATILGVTRSRRTAARWARTAADAGRTVVIIPTPDGYRTVWAERRERTAEERADAARRGED